jgi:hypothetical protein
LVENPHHKITHEVSEVEVKQTAAAFLYDNCFKVVTFFINPSKRLGNKIEDHVERNDCQIAKQNGER